MKNFTVQAVIDIFFDTSMPAVTLFGDLYKLGFDNIKETSLRQLPEQIRKDMPELKYQGLFELSSSNENSKNIFKINLGNNVLGISTVNDVSWDDFKKESLKVFDILIKKTKADIKLNRLGLRYVSFVEGTNIFNSSNLAFEISGRNIGTSKALNLKFEDFIDEIKIVESVIYPMRKSHEDEAVGTLIDIITAKENIINSNEETFKDFFNKYIQELYIMNQSRFTEMIPNE